MNIVCLISALKLGGAERQMLGLADVLQKAGHNVEVLTYHEEIFFSHVITDCSLKHCQIEMKGTLIGFLTKVARHLDDFGCDVLIAYKAGTSMKACALKLMRPKIRLFVSERNMNLSYLPHDAFRFLTFKVCADKVICNSHSQEQFIRKHFPSLGDKVITITNFVDSDQFFPTLISPHSPKRIIVTARIARRKNMEGMIRAAEILKSRKPEGGFIIDWYGMSRRSGYLDNMLGLIESRSLSDVFHIHSAVADVSDRYHEADIICLPSFYEGTSNSLAEALACGKIAVCSDVSDNSLYVKEGENGFLCDPHSPESIADALEKALSLDAVKAGRFSVAVVSEKLSLDSFRESYLSLLQKTLPD